MHKERIVYIVASIFGIIAAFFPLVHASVIPELMHGYSMRVPYPTGSEGIIIFALIILLAASGETQKPLKQLSRITTLVLGLIPIIFLILFVTRHQASEFSLIPLSFQLGFYLMVFASLAVVASVVYFWKLKKFSSEHVYEVQRFVIILAAAVGLVASFFPFANTGEAFQSGLQANFTSGGLVIFALFLLSLIAASLGGLKKPMNNWRIAASVVPGVIPAAIINLLWLRNMSLDFTTPAISFAFGFYFMLVASLVIFVLGINVKNKPISP